MSYKIKISCTSKKEEEKITQHIIHKFYIQNKFYCYIFK